MSSREFIDNIENNNNLEAEENFSRILVNKVGISLEERRYGLANDLVNEKTANQILRDTGKKKPEMTPADLAKSSAKANRIITGDKSDKGWKNIGDGRPVGGGTYPITGDPVGGAKPKPKPKPKPQVGTGDHHPSAKPKPKPQVGTGDHHPKRNGKGGVAADYERAGREAPSKPNKELDIGAGPKKPSKKPKVVQPGDTKHPLDTSDIESGATGGQPKKPSKKPKEWSGNKVGTFPTEDDRVGWKKIMDRVRNQGRTRPKLPKDGPDTLELRPSKRGDGLRSGGADTLEYRPSKRDKNRPLKDYQYILPTQGRSKSRWKPVEK